MIKGPTVKLNITKGHNSVNGVTVFGLGLASQTKGQCCHTETINPCQKIYGKRKKKTSKSAKYRLPLRYKESPLKNNVFGFGHHIIKLKFTTNFDRCAILNIINCLTKNFES